MHEMMPKQPAVFIDRDGVINHDPGHLHKITQLQIFPGVPEAISLLNGRKILAIVVTNQSAVARGLITEDGVKKIHKEIENILFQGNARIDRFYYCPHHPDAELPEYRVDCNCRKPATGMFEQAAEEFGIDLEKSYVIGDSFREIEAARSLGCTSIAVECGSSDFGDSTPDYKVGNLYEAVELIVGKLHGSLFI